MDELNGPDVRIILNIKEELIINKLKKFKHKKRLNEYTTLQNCKEKKKYKKITYHPEMHRKFQKIFDKCNISLAPINKFSLGRGFGALRKAPGDKIYIETTLNGSVLDTDALPITDEPHFDSELMWESNKKSLRRLRSDCTTIKILCFMVGESLMKPERVGHCTISLREARIVPSGKSFEEIGESWWHWQKLNGIKPPYQEILYSLRLEGRPEMPNKPNLHMVKETKTKINPQKQAQKSKLPNLNLITRLHSDKGVIQIGSDETATEYFTLTIYVGQAVNLNL
ncbi:hypothetical protein L9F63_024248, partial [Diploptera punctata]